MTQLLHIHPINPQPRLIAEVVETLNNNGVIACPTNSSYALICTLDNKEAVDRIRQIREIGKHHNFTLMCRDLSDLGVYARVSNPTFRLLKTHTPGGYTFILHATHEVPRRLQHPKRKTVGLRVPAHPIATAILEALGGPVMSTTLILPHETTPLSDAEEIYEKLKGRVDLVVDGGPCGTTHTTVVDLTEGAPKVLREGKGDPKPFL